MTKFYSFLGKYVFTYENSLSLIILFLFLCLTKTVSDVDKLKAQAISHGFAKYDEIKGNWRWVTEEDMHK
jgi:hypothetical protein